MRILCYFFVFVAFISCDERSGSFKTQDMDSVAVKELISGEQQQIENPTSRYAHLPRLKAHKGKLHMTWVEQEDSLAVLKYSVYNQSTWSPVEVIALGTDWFVNWADFPAVAINNGTVMATFLQKSAKGTYDYDIKYTLKNNETGQWSSPQTLHNDTTAAEHGFVSLLPYQKGFFATWLDGRNTKSSGGGHDSHDYGAGGAMTLRSALIDSKGSITKRTELDESICDCCNTSAVQTEEGLVIVYRDRSEGDPETRDIYRVIWNEESTIVPAPVHNDNWKINGCPVNGPAIDAINNTAVTAWFTAANDTPQVLAAFSQDGGRNFATPVRVDFGDAIGRVDTVLLTDGSAIVLWMEPQGEEVVLQTRKINRRGTLGTTKTITALSGERMSGFPQIEMINDMIFIAYTDIQGENASVQLIYHPL